MWMYKLLGKKMSKMQVLELGLLDEVDLAEEQQPSTNRPSFPTERQFSTFDDDVL